MTEDSNTRPPGNSASNSRRPSSGRGQNKKRKDNKLKITVSTSDYIRSACDADLEDATYIVFDIESTGGNPSKNGITEICALKFVGGKVVDEFYSMVNPLVPIPPIVRKMTGINNQMVKDAPLIGAVMPDFVKFIGNGILVSHNTIGDMKFLRYFSEEVCGEQISNFFLCTHLLVEKLVPEAPNKSLTGLAEYYGFLPEGELHRASADAFVTLDLFLKLKALLKEKGYHKVEEGVRFQGDFESGMRLGWGLNDLNIDALPSLPGVFYLYDQHGKLRFFSSALNLKRDVRKLTRYAQLPRQMLRLVLGSYKFEYKKFDSHFEALRHECREIVDRKMKFNPVNWHQRTISCIHMSLTDGFIKLGVGPVIPDAIAAFGPSTDRKQAFRLLDQVAHICGSQMTNDGVLIEKHLIEIVVAFLDGKVEICLASLTKQRSSLMNLFLKARRRALDLQISTLESLSALSYNGNFKSILDTAGVAIISPEHITQGKVYGFSNGLVNGEETVEGDVKEILEDPIKKQVVQRICKKLKPEKAQDQKIGEEGAVFANSILWWIYSSTCRKDGRFVDSVDIRSKK